MSGGFFRGTSADQDTRFSNKQAKLMKSHKFPSELEQLVDITKVKMDVMKPWIAQRATELLGFEDEVLINFIYGLLDGKAVNGKEVQISLTGFMEKNTGKFMKELWQLLLSAQNNASGVPQQLLDAKEEETRKKQAESDKIKSEMQKKEKEHKEFEEEKMKKLDVDAGMNRTDTATLEPRSKRHPEASYDEEISTRNGVRGRDRILVCLEVSMLKIDMRSSILDNVFKYCSLNRASKSPQSPAGVSLSLKNRRSTSLRKSFSYSRSYSEEKRKSRGLSRSPTSRGHSISSERVHRSRRRRSITPRRKYSPSLSKSPPIRRSSHSRRRSTSRSRWISPSPIRHRMRTPETYMSRSPIRRRSQTPVRRRPRSPPRYQSRSPVRRRYRSPIRRRSPSPVQRRYHRSPSTPPLRSPSPIRRRSPIRNRRRSPTPPRHRPPSQEALSSPPVRRLSPPVKKRLSKRHRSPLRSPREKNRNDGNQKLKPSERPATSSKPDRHKDIIRVDRKHDYSPERSAGHHSSETRNCSDGVELRKKELDGRSEKTSSKVLHPEDLAKESVPAFHRDSQKADEKIQPLSYEAKHMKHLRETDKSTVKDDENGGSGSLSYGSDDSLKRHNRKGHDYRKRRRSGKKELTSDDISDSEIEDRKVTKRRKEEKRSRKEEKRRRREERLHKREERRAEKLKAKSNDDIAAEETVSDQKKLEIELREKALESLRAKKGVGH